jgi:hypothetical protein
MLESVKRGSRERLTLSSPARRGWGAMTRHALGYAGFVHHGAAIDHVTIRALGTSAPERDYRERFGRKN